MPELSSSASESLRRTNDDNGAIGMIDDASGGRADDAVEPAVAVRSDDDKGGVEPLGVNICERVIELRQEPVIELHASLPKMAESAQRMVREALDAFVGGDPERAQQVIESDRLVDAYYAQISGDLLAAMMQDTKRVYA